MKPEDSVVANIAPPTAEKLAVMWAFRAACHLKEPHIAAGLLFFGVILDLGFGIYRQIPAQLFGVTIAEGKKNLVKIFAANWAENGQPNDLVITTIETRSGWGAWLVHVERHELDADTLKVTHLSSLADVLVEQGLCTRDA